MVIKKIVDGFDLKYGFPVHLNDNKTLVHTYDEAAALQGVGKFHLMILFVSGMSCLSFIVEIMGISLMMDAAKCDLNFTLYEQGFLASAGFLGVVLSSHATGLLADTCGRVKTLKITILFAGVISLISAFSVSVWMLTILRFFVGVFITGCQSCVFSYLGEFHSNRTRSKYVTMLSTFFTIGTAYMPVVAMIILPFELNFYIGDLKFSSWRLFLLISSLPTLIVAISLQFCPESPKFLLVQGRHDEALEILKLGYSINMNKPKDSYPVRKIELSENSSLNLKNVKNCGDAFKVIWNQTIPLFHRERVWHTLNLCLHQFMIYCLAHGLFMWFPGLLTSMGNHMDENFTVCEVVNKLKINATLSNDDICDKKADMFVLTILFIMGIAFGIIYIVFAAIIDRMRKKILLVSWMLICAVCTIVPYWSKGFYINTIMLFFILAYGNCAGIVTTFSMLYFPTNVNAMGMCLIMMTGRLGAFAGSNIIGLILTYNCEMLFLIFVGIMICLMILSLFLPENKMK